MASSPPEPSSTGEGRRVLAVAHEDTTLPGDLTGLLADARVAVSVTTPTPRVEPLLREQGWSTLPWDRARAERGSWDLVVTTREQHLDQLEHPSVLLVADPESEFTGQAALARHIALTDPVQQEALAAAAPESASVVGDLTVHRLVAAAGRRERYRQALHLEGRRLVVLAPGPDVATDVGRLRQWVRGPLAELDHARYRVALLADPATWTHWGGHDHLALRLYDEVEAGLVLVPPQAQRAALIAADLVLASGGPAARWAHALGCPVRAWGSGGSVPSLEEPAHAGPISRAVADPDRELAPAPGTGETARSLRTLLYRMLDLGEPSAPARLAPLPDVPEAPDPVRAWRAYTHEVTGHGLSIDLHPAGAPTTPERTAVLPLMVDRDEPSMPYWAAADAWVCTRPVPEDEAAQWVAGQLAAYPKARVAVCALGPHAVLVRHRRAGSMMRVESEEPVSPRAVAGAAVVRQRAGQAPDGWQHVHLTYGGRSQQLRGAPAATAPPSS